MRKKPAAQDWHNADIVCGLWKRGTSLQRLSREHGYSNKSLSVVLHLPWRRGEEIIAHALAVSPRDIWPSRFNADGSRKIHRKSQHSTGANAVNGHIRRAT